MYADMFTASSDSIESVNDGKTGLELVVKNDYDLILLDIRMPKYSGIDFLQDLKEQRPSELKKIVVASLLQFNETQVKELMEFGIHSVENKPSTFPQIESLQKIVSKNRAGKKLSSIRILIIDDQSETTTKISKFFKSKGFQTTVTNDPFKGLKYIQEEEFDVILLNMYMPEFSGLQIIRMLATDEILQEQNIFILPAVFGHNNQIKELIKRDGISGFLEKSMDLDEILKTITKDFNLQKAINSEII
jgi:CheY-like chemotaxis protein